MLTTFGAVLLLMTQTIDFTAADALFTQHKPADALEQYQQLVEQAEQAGDAAAQVRAMAMTARCFTMTQQLDDARRWIDRTAEFATPDEPQGWSRFLVVRGIVEREEGDRDKARATFTEAYTYCHERKLHHRALDAIHHIGIVVPPTEQVDWHRKAIAEAEALESDGWLAVLWNNLGATYDDLKQYNDALPAYLQARKYHHKTGSDREKLIADWAVGRAYRLCGQHDEARTWLEDVLPRAEQRYADEPSPDTAEWVGWCRKDLGELRIATGDRPGGVALMRKGRDALIEAGIEKWGARLLAQIDQTIADADR